MLQRHEFSGSVVIYRSPLLLGLGLRHGFSTRLGGISQGAYASLNLGLGPEAPPAEAENVEKNLDRFCRAIDLDARRLVRVRQVHGSRAIQAGDPALCNPSCEADALISTQPDFGVAVRTADCVPLLVADASGRSVAAIHAGWRGVVAGIISRSLEQLRSTVKNSRADFFAAIGPAIGLGAFEVGEEVAAAFCAADLGDCVLRQPGRKPHVDLQKAAGKQLERCGIPAECIDTSDQCTWRDAEEFFSHRRDQGNTGRLLAAIAPK